MPPVISNHPERYVDQIFEQVLTTYAMQDTLTTSLQDWVKGRRAEVAEVNGLVVVTLATHGLDAPMNKRVVALAQEIEAGQRSFEPANAALLIETYNAIIAADGRQAN